MPPFIPGAIVYVSRGQFFVVPLWSLGLPALVMSGGIWNFMFKVSVSVLGFTRCLDVPPFGP